jgi:hypothetical protein
MLVLDWRAAALGRSGSYSRGPPGHAGPAITLRVYAHVIRAAEAVAADIFAQAANAVLASTAHANCPHGAPTAHQMSSSRC